MRPATTRATASGPAPPRGAIAFALAAWLLAGALAAPAQQGAVLPPEGGQPGTGLQQAEDRLAAGDAAGAEALFRRLMAAYPGMAEAWDGLARALAAQGRSREAGAVLLRLGEGFLNAGAYERALGYLERAVARDATSAPAHAALGRALLLNQAFARGQEHLQRAVELGDGSLLTRTYLGSAQWENGHLDLAEATLRQVVATGGGFAPRHQLARLLLWRGRHAEALQLIESLLATHPGSVDVQLDYAGALEGSGALDEAVAAYRRVIQLAPERSHAHYRLALLLRRQGEMEAAREAMATFERLYRAEQRRVQEKGLARARLDRAWELLGQGQPLEAMERFAALPETGESLRGLALAASAAGRHGEAVTILERAVSLQPDDEAARLLLASERLALEAAGPGGS